MKLQDWVVHAGYATGGHFRGSRRNRKRRFNQTITQRLYPRLERRVAGAYRPGKRNGIFNAMYRVYPLPVKSLVVQPVRRQRVMCFAPAVEVEQFFDVPEFERMLALSDIKLIKYCSRSRTNSNSLDSHGNGPLKQWKLSPMDLQSRTMGEINESERRYAGTNQHSGSALVYRRG